MMESPRLPDPAPPPPKNSYTWPIIINLALLLLAAAGTGGDPAAMSGPVAALALLNAITAAVAGFRGKLKWVIVFVSTALLILLIGFGTCMLMLKGTGGGN